jgi:death-on-curing protein
MNREIRFLSLDDIMFIHSAQMERYGGHAGIRDRKLLDSAVAVPQSTFDGEFLHADLFEMAAAYAYHIAQNQPFLDGNKRTGLMAALVFLDLNGITIEVKSEELYEIMIDIAFGKKGKSELASLLRDIAG